MKPPFWSAASAPPRSGQLLPMALREMLSTSMMGSDSSRAIRVNASSRSFLPHAKSRKVVPVRLFSRLSWPATKSPSGPGLIRHATYQTYHASGSWGAIGGAAAAGKLLGLTQESIRHAMGIAEYHAPIAPMMKGIASPSMVKDGIGWGAMVAMSSTLLARDGFTGIEPLFNDTPRVGMDFRPGDVDTRC